MNKPIINSLTIFLVMVLGCSVDKSEIQQRELILDTTLRNQLIEITEHNRNYRLKTELFDALINNDTTTLNQIVGHELSNRLKWDSLTTENCRKIQNEFDLQNYSSSNVEIIRFLLNQSYSGSIIKIDILHNIDTDSIFLEKSYFQSFKMENGIIDMKELSQSITFNISKESWDQIIDRLRLAEFWNMIDYEKNDDRLRDIHPSFWRIQSQVRKYWQTKNEYKSVELVNPNGCFQEVGLFMLEISGENMTEYQ